ncbi:MAG: glycosyltransferase family 4 protein, partial [Rhizobiales bacterium]|nr:glycosyltransferase family 4 protein [Hyphomicrobiales bacterium]
VIMHGIDTERFSPPADKAAAKAALGLDPAQKYVGCFGRIRHQKGTDLFVDAMIALLPERPDWSAIIAGRATAQHVEFETELKEKVRAAGLDKRILFVGDHTNIHEWYRPLDLFVAPQRWEGFGLTPLEAMATGVPVVATDVGAFSELIVTGATGTVIPVGDYEILSASVCPFLADATRTQNMGWAAGKQSAEKFNVTKEASSLDDFYKMLVA